MTWAAQVTLDYMGHLDALADSWHMTREPSVTELLEARCKRCRVALMLPLHAAGERKREEARVPSRKVTQRAVQPVTGELEALSEREVEIAVTIALGHSNRSAARELFLSENTIKSHKVRIFKKLGIKNSAQLGVLVAKAGLV